MLASIHARRPSRRLILLALALAGLVSSGGCDSLNEVFTGRWVSTQPAHSGLIEGAPELAIGHFGREVAGVAYFKIIQAGSEFVAACPCSFIEHQDLNLDRRELDFSTSCEGLALDWRLKLRTEGVTAFLEGTVRRADGSPGELSVSLERVEALVRDEEKLCPPAGS